MLHRLVGAPRLWCDTRQAATNGCARWASKPGDRKGVPGGGGGSLKTVLGQDACSQKDLKTWFVSVPSGLSSEEAVRDRRPEEVALGLHTKGEDGSGALSRLAMAAVT